MTRFARLGFSWWRAGLALALGLVAAALAAPLSAALPSKQDIAFQVLRDSEPIGHHRVAFRREGEALHVEIDIALEVKLAFLTVFRYSHSNREVWQDGRLTAIDTQTDDNGDAYWLRGRATETGFTVEGSSGDFTAPADIMPTSYWNPDTVSHSRLLDTQRGGLLEVAIAPAGSEIVLVEGRPLNTQRYRMSGDLELDLWYATDGEWAKIRFAARGAEVVYARPAEKAPENNAVKDPASGE